MKIETSRTVKIEELTPIIPFEAGGTWNMLWQVFYYTRLFKYIHKRQYKEIKYSYIKICTHDKLHKLCELGYLDSPQKDIFTATNKVLPILEEAGYNTSILPPEAEGTGSINVINNTQVFIQALSIPHVEAFLFPQFKDTISGLPYLIPDALLVQIHREKKRYKLTFLEIEAEKKLDWNQYVEKKKDNYMRLSQDINFYKYWSLICPKLGLPIPDIQTLGFSVCFVGNITKDFGKAFMFKQSLRHEKSR
jgi:hypothetical protein